MKSITRKTMLYKTGVEYGDYTMNHVLGCAHGCKYPCYAFLQKKRFGKVSSYEEWIEPKIVSNTLDLLDVEIPKLKKKIQVDFMNLASDLSALSGQSIVLQFLHSCIFFIYRRNVTSASLSCST